MTTEECTAYIENYFNSERTRPGSAIMLTSSWGSGKSYYIDNELIKKLGRDKCVKVSLYGLKSLDEISKAIYIEMRALQWPRRSEATRKVVLFGRTVLRGIFSYFKLNLEPKESELQDIYKSVNLEGKLVIFEDVERSSIPIVDIMGYVNNLCEQDQVKVLLVINEDEICESEDGLKAYHRIKEKTVSDTIIFSCSIETPIRNILTEFQAAECEVSEYFANIDVKEICSIMRDDVRGRGGDGYNFRSLIFACQKTQDLFDRVYKSKSNIQVTPDFFADCLYSIIAFSLKFKRGDDQNNQYSVWTSDMDSPGILGHIKYPLLKDCYDFIVTQKFDSKLFAKTVSEYPRIKQKDANWRKLNAYDRYPFPDLVGALNGIESLIRQKKFPLSDLGTLISKLYSIKAALKGGIAVEKVDKLLNSIIKQLNTAKFSPSTLYNKIVVAAYPTGGLDDLKQEYESYKLEISNIIVRKAVNELIGLTCQKKRINQFRKTIDVYESSSTDLFNLIRPEFTSCLKVNELVDVLATRLPNIVADFADGFCRLYLRGGETSVEKGLGANQQGGIASGLLDASQMVNLSDGESNRIKELIDCLNKKIEDPCIDIITKLQLKRFAERLVKISKESADLG